MSDEAKPGFVRTSAHLRETTENLKGAAENIAAIFGQFKKLFYAALLGIGFFGDVLKPFYNVLSLVVLIGIGLFILAVILVIIVRRQRQTQRFASGIVLLVIFAISFFALAAFFVITPYEGLLATQVDGINNVQVNIAHNILDNQEKAKVIQLRRELRDVIKEAKESDDIDPLVVEQAQKITAIDPNILEQTETIRKIDLQEVKRIDSDSAAVLTEIKDDAVRVIKEKEKKEERSLPSGRREELPRDRRKPPERETRDAINATSTPEVGR